MYISDKLLYLYVHTFISVRVFELGGWETGAEVSGTGKGWAWVVSS